MLKEIKRMIKSNSIFLKSVTGILLIIITGFILIYPITVINTLANTEPSSNFVYAGVLENYSIICVNSPLHNFPNYSNYIPPSLSINFYVLFLNSYDKPIINSTVEMCICEYVIDNDSSFQYPEEVLNMTNAQGISEFHYIAISNYYGNDLSILNLKIDNNENFQYIVEKPSYTSNNLTKSDFGKKEITNYTEIFQFQNMGFGMIGYEPLIYSYSKDASMQKFDLSVSSRILSNNGKSIYKNFTLNDISYNLPYTITSQNNYILMNEAENTFYNRSLGINVTIPFNINQLYKNDLVSNFENIFSPSNFWVNITNFQDNVIGLSGFITGSFILVSFILAVYIFGFFLKSPNTENIIRGPFKKRDIVLGTFFTYIIAGLLSFAVGILSSGLLLQIINSNLKSPFGINPFSFAVSFLIYFITLITVGAITLVLSTMSKRGISYVIFPLLLYFLLNNFFLSIISSIFNPENYTIFPGFIKIGYFSLPVLRDYSLIYSSNPLQSQTALYYYIFRTYPLGGFAYNHLSSILYFSPVIMISVPLALSILMVVTSIKLYSRD